MCTQESPALAETQHRISTYVLGEFWDDDETPWHPAAMLRWDIENLPGNSRFGLEYNTDTIRLELDGLELGSHTEFGARITGEAKGTNVLFDYFQQGKTVAERSINASFIGGQVWLKFKLFDDLYIQPELGARKWFLEASANRTSPNLVLPQDSFVAEPRLHITWWRLDYDALWSERMRLYPRHNGWAIGASFGLDWQQDVRAWGALDSNHFSPTDPRNDPQNLQYRASQWLWAGWKVCPGFRTQIIEEIGWSEGEDDLSRRPIGGLTPYTVNIPGVPWAYFHVGDYAGLQWTTHFPILTEGLEIGTVASAVVLRDVDRIGATDFSTIWGVGGIVDWRLEDWQINLRGGYSPALNAEHPEQGAWSALFSLGWNIVL